ncbi:uncharacterized protein EV420DRAFT_1476629 [Desarmillaria tabescens]|uniref:Uncharacterized protein n=1 Tax=Armillaria tabescens TaxID=1929756 RepID=A0AA39TQC8_ARMTA|nr:uncharacterized protein EV420DRAFT_1476629 [Desarmillaria tabescens]KAK0462838.1 hypothetical protein EV420DRAFT_1476629 [Desarmillaria tabescens]
MSTFSSLTIHDFCIEREPITMHRAPSFPSLRYTSEPTIPIPSDQWPPPDPVPITGRSLEIRLLDKVAEGRAGLVHSVQVLTEASPSLPELCIKVAKPRYCRSLAREAWFYSRLETLQGSAVPLCFGFFTAPIADCIPWNRISLKETSAEVDDWLPDDMGVTKPIHHAWDRWKYAPDQPLVAVLVMEKLGEPSYQDCRDPSHESVFTPEAEEDQEFAESRIEEKGSIAYLKKKLLDIHCTSLQSPNTRPAICSEYDRAETRSLFNEQAYKTWRCMAGHEPSKTFLPSADHQEQTSRQTESRGMRQFNITRVRLFIKEASMHSSLLENDEHDAAGQDGMKVEDGSKRAFS